ncbi:DMT family transporter [Novipirellula aureliae]|nr:DMT family transporter [Novipirellula aureliae]
MHLLLPFAASILFVCGLIFIKRASELDVGPATILFFSNMMSTLLFSCFWLLGGPGQPIELIWQPIALACLYMMGLVFTFASVQAGDVSIATPIFGTKVIFVTLLLTFATSESVTSVVRYAAFMATMGIVLIQWTGRGNRRRMILTIVLALSAAISFASFDVLVQAWSPSWGIGRILPPLYWSVGLISLGLIPWVDWDRMKISKVRRAVLPGTLLVSTQAVCIILAVALFGDAARVNVVYALRGLWGVTLAWAAAKIWGGAEADLPKSIMIKRVIGACLLTAAVILVVVS